MDVKNYNDWLNLTARQAGEAFKKAVTEAFQIEKLRKNKKVDEVRRGPSALISDDTSLLKQLPIDEQTQSVVENLFKDAFNKGLAEVPLFKASYIEPKAGSTAQIVLQTNILMEFYVKVDSSNKLNQEAKNLMAIRHRDDLPEEFKVCFPGVYSVKSDKAPFGYLMESFAGDQYVGFDKICFIDKCNQSDIVRILDIILDLFFKAYNSSKTSLLAPNLTELYIKRIEDRVHEARTISNSFSKFTDASQVKINGVGYDRVESYLESIKPYLNKLTPQFSTFVHGDPHPENILVKKSIDSIRVRFIDPKEWIFSDYIFDIGKLVHYLEVTGIVEQSGSNPNFDLNEAKNNLTYSINQSDSITYGIEHIKERVKDFAENIDDPTWHVRFKLSMASNLLGLSAARLNKGNTISAFLTYAEGLKWLAQTSEAVSKLEK